MEVLHFDDVIDVNDTVFIYENRSKVFYIDRKKSFYYTSSDPFLLVELFDRFYGDDEDPNVEKFSKIKDLKTGHVFEIALSSLSLKPNDINKFDRFFVRMFYLFLIISCGMFVTYLLTK